MARPSKTALIDYSKSHALTHGLLERAACPPDRPFVLVKDAENKGLRLRVTKAGGKHWQFETRMKGSLITKALGEWPAVGIANAQAAARTLRNQTEQGIDPREVQRQQDAEKAATLALAAAQEVTVGEAWSAYIADRRPYWGELHLRDHLEMVSPGGEPKKRGKGLTEPGPLAHFCPLRLVDVTAEHIQAWADDESNARPTRARLALRLFHAFLNWCQEHQQFQAITPEKNPAANRRAREKLGTPEAKKDALLKEQLAAWFVAVQGLQNQVIAAYLQVLLLTGARPNELLILQWPDINTQWRGLTLRDKDESKGGKDGMRTIPLTPYVEYLLLSLPRRNRWVFSSDVTDLPISPPNRRLADACAVCGIGHITLHGLRRSFGSLSEWLELPAGAIAQIQGHKPSGTAEKHYRVRPLDLLRLHHERLEAWILEQAGIQFDSNDAPSQLRAVK